VKLIYYILTILNIINLIKIQYFRKIETQKYDLIFRKWKRIYCVVYARVYQPHIMLYNYNITQNVISYTVVHLPQLKVKYFKWKKKNTFNQNYNPKFSVWQVIRCIVITSVTI